MHTLVLISAGTAEDDVVINRHENAVMLLSIHTAAARGFLDGTATDITYILGRELVDPLTVAAAAAHS
ncbi:hypothetical protein [Arthrobacter cavernae]|uniref:Uncharacterized protein n=1 Tax=Arthrobacter cavernae TaxID=2817681 RepID=A0A939HFL8_9MICC|nr:hypothetical protein [Arthrobacter cavernae]MBO1269994.1 hypothetical protein [Arthrobacter cavernae]